MTTDRKPSYVFYKCTKAANLMGSMFRAFCILKYKCVSLNWALLYVCDKFEVCIHSCLRYVWCTCNSYETSDHIIIGIEDLECTGTHVHAWTGTADSFSQNHQVNVCMCKI